MLKVTVAQARRIMKRYGFTGLRTYHTTGVWWAEVLNLNTDKGRAASGTSKADALFCLVAAAYLEYETVAELYL